MAQFLFTQKPKDVYLHQNLQMPNTAVITEIFRKFQNSISNGTFAKLTLTKTIGKPALQNIYVRAKIVDSELKLGVTFKVYDEELIETEEVIELKDAQEFLSPYINNPFMWILLFTTKEDVTMKLNKKRVASITEKEPTFKNPDTTLAEFQAK